MAKAKGECFIQLTYLTVVLSHPTVFTHPNMVTLCKFPLRGPISKQSITTGLSHNDLIDKQSQMASKHIHDH